MKTVHKVKICKSEIKIWCTLHVKVTKFLTKLCKLFVVEQTSFIKLKYVQINMLCCNKNL